jgi:predicted RNA-binding Zn ribbon-like protein
MPDSEFILLGSALWLDFVNTEASPPAARDVLTAPGSWHRWAAAAQLAAPSHAADPEEARRFRSRLAALAHALTQGGSPPSAAVHAVNGWLNTLAGCEQLVRVGGAWRLRFAPGRPPEALQAIAASAAQTLADPLVLVRRCADPDCGLYFLDESPTQVRYWCGRAHPGQPGRVERRRASRLTPLVSDG